jgi:hypothetical protein
MSLRNDVSFSKEPYRNTGFLRKRNTYKLGQPASLDTVDIKALVALCVGGGVG